MKLPARELPFMKMEGLGNHFVVGADPYGRMTPEIVRKIACKEDGQFDGTGILADGVIMVLEPRLDRRYDADFRMMFSNSNGKTAQMCGNGVRCLAKYLVDNRLAEVGRPIPIDTDKGLVIATVTENSDPRAMVQVDMGCPQFYLASQLNLNSGLDEVFKNPAGPNYRINFGGDLEEARLLGTFVSMGNPHVVIFTEVGKSQEFALKYGPIIERREETFPEKVNVEFAVVTGRQELRMDVYERGEGITRACGTGACSTLVAARANNLTRGPATIHLQGGDLYVSWEGSTDSPVYMTGPANNVCELKGLERYLLAGLL